MKYFGAFLLFVFCCIQPVAVHASLLTFSADGELYFNVLGLSDTSDSSLEIKKIADNYSIKNESVSLVNESGKIYLSYNGSSKKVDLTNYKNDIVQIEEKDAPTTVSIKGRESGFEIVQRGIVTYTEYPIKINSPENQISIATDTGERYVSFMPYEAVRMLARTNMITEVAGGNIQLAESAGEPAYVISGTKLVTLFKIFSFNVPITAHVSAANGNVVKVDQPIWYSLIGYFLG